MHEDMMLESALLKYGNVEVCYDNGSLYGDREVEVIYNKYTDEFEVIVQ